VDSELRVLKRVQHTCKCEGSEEKEGRFRERIPTFNSERQILTGLLWRNQGECNTETESPGSTLNLMHHELGRY